MSFKITIINNENGNVILNDENAKAIVGAVVNKVGVLALGHVRCNAVELLRVLEAADRARDKLLEQHPELKMPYALKGLMDLCKSNSDNTNND